MLQKLTTVLLVDAIEAQLPNWKKLGFSATTEVPEKGKGTLGFVILQGKAGELMLQTHASFAEDLPEIAKRKPKLVLYADVPSLSEAKRALPDAKVIVAERKTFYGATESWLELPDNTFIGLSQH